MVNKLADKIRRTIDSKGFSRFVIVFFVLESAWIALTAAYPQAFDEQFHFGLIKLYSHHLSPFLSKQPANATQFGAVARDPSYLYHYLMSFPYRLIELITKTQPYQVVALRFIDIGMFAYGLVLFRRILLKTKLSQGMANLAVFIFALIPIVPQLAGQINYDDMLIPLVAGACLLAFKMIDEIKTHKLTFKTTAYLLIICLFASLVKYAFLPIFLAILIFFAVYLLHSYQKKISTIWGNFIRDFKKQSLPAKTILIGLVLLGIGMFAQRDLVNIVEYHSIAPSCSSVLSINQCKAYSAWYADYKRHESVLNGTFSKPSKDIFVYSAQWIYWMWYRLFFAVNGAASKFTNYPPLPLPSAIALVIGVTGVIAVIKYRKELFKANAHAVLLLMATLFYTVSLVLQGFSTYQFTDVLENMNGRYLLPVLLLAGALMVKAFSMAFKKRGSLKVLVAIVIVVLFLEGGGVLTYIARSDPSWYFNNSKAVKANDVVRKITNKIVVSDPKTYDTPVWFFNYFYGYKHVF